MFPDLAGYLEEIKTGTGLNKNLLSNATLYILLFIEEL
jgi:hypothetical protein